MTKRVKEAIKRLEQEVKIWTTRSSTCGSQYALFIEDLAVLVKYVKEKK